MPTLGVLMLETRFPRPRGDIGNPATFEHPVAYAVVSGASPRRVVSEGDATLLAPFVEAARSLVAAGADAIATSCGFLVRFQDALAAALPVPVWTSSLLVLRRLDRPGVLTVDAAAFDERLLRAAGEPRATPVEGLAPGCALQRTLLEDLPTLDVADAERETVAAALRLVARHPGLTDIVLECTNLPPYAAAVRAATGRPVHDITTLIASQWRRADQGMSAHGRSEALIPERAARRASQ